MTNVKYSSLKDGIDTITDYAPVVIFVSIIAMYGLAGWIQHHFMRDVLISSLNKVESLSFQFPILIQSLRFILGFVCVSFFKKGRWFFGSLVFGLSIWLAVFEYSKVDAMATFWTDLELTTRAITHSDLRIKITKDIIIGIMTILVWGALILEFFLAAWVGYDDNLTVSDSSNDIVFSSNGKGKKIKATTS